MIFLFVGALIILALFFVMKEFQNQVEEVDVSVSEIQAYETLRSKPINWTDVESTEQLEELFKGVKYDSLPRIFIRRFPADFGQKGNPALFAEVLLPHLLRQNELLLAERDAFLAIVNKMKSKLLPMNRYRKDTR